VVGRLTLLTHNAETALQTMPVAGVDYPASFRQLRSWFPDDDACVEYLARLRWPDGFRCPRCGNADAWRTGPGLWLCQGCRRKTSVTAGTIFHRSRLPLTDWFAAAWFVTSQKTGVSALGLQRALGLGSYETAWSWMHKLCRAMVRPDRDRLDGIVEVDETFVGAYAKSAPKRCAPSSATPSLPVPRSAPTAGTSTRRWRRPSATSPSR
jgi:transposase-like protein